MSSIFVPLSIGVIVPVLSMKVYDLAAMDTEKEKMKRETAEFNTYKNEYNTCKSMAMIAVASVLILLGALLSSVPIINAVSFGFGLGGMFLLISTILQNWYLYGLGMQVMVLGASLAALVAVGCFRRSFRAY